MASAEPLVIAPGNGLERGRNGGSGVCAAIALRALMGKLGAASGIILAAGNVFPRTPARLTRPDLLPSGTRTLNILDIGRHLVVATIMYRGYVLWCKDYDCTPMSPQDFGRDSPRTKRKVGTVRYTDCELVPRYARGNCASSPASP
jgi:hypothetical protein